MNQTLMTLIVTASVFGAAFMAWHLATAGSIACHRSFTDAARSRLDEQFLFINPNIIFVAMIGGAVVAPLAIWLLTGNLFWAIVTGAAAFAAPKVAYLWINRKRRLKMVLQLPDVLLMLASSLRAGTSLQIAMDISIRETPAPLSQELGVVMREQRLGLAMEDALQTMGARLKMEEVDLVVAAMTIARDTGGNLAETLDRLAGTLRAKAIMEGKIRALTSQGKLQGLVVGALPIFMMMILSSLQHDAMMPLFHRWYGWVVLGVIFILELIGFMLIRKIVNIDV
jgi:tight adherence protein B